MKSILPAVLTLLILGCSTLQAAPADYLDATPAQHGDAMIFARTLTQTEQPDMSPAEPVRHDGVVTMDLTRQSPDIWIRVRKGFGMPDLVSPLVDRQIQALTARPENVTRILERSRKYLYHIVTELEKRGMPTELALLPLVESAFNPMAYSPAKAAGLWQFIPSTGRDFQLRQNWWVDERRDILASTNAALQYLQAVYEMQGDWQLALASYNWGENAVMRAVNANRNAGRPTDFNALNMPNETRQYVPKLQAIKQIVAHPEQYGVRLPEIPNSPYFVNVERSVGMDVALAARFAEMPLAEFQSLNPAYNRPVIPGSHDADLLLPVENARKFEENLAAHGSEPLMSWKTYTVPRASRLEDLARRLKVNAETLRLANGLPARARLAAGYTLLVPRSVDTAAADVEDRAAPPAPRSAARHLNKAATRSTPSSAADSSRSGRRS